MRSGFERLAAVVLLAGTVFSVQALEIGQPAPQFRLPLLNSEPEPARMGISDLHGQLVLLDFWASWCGPCRKSLPFLDELQSRYSARGFQVLAVSLDDSAAAGLGFLQQYPVGYTNLLDVDSDVADLYQVRGMPTSVLIDRDGKVAWVHPGFKEQDKDQIEQQIQSRLPSN
ncbi:TlpA family protein disulfide reductase [Oceanobacter mangrovi]|uniref:TlpA family protein disulfide reductase n=1 Tax=Oceanobacter mangrovi TaxID=2862510 RepID=UPI001C8D3DB9|nr:TlpA disulfide reductase family protein [Oceanobacter mangrovi]